MSVDTDTYLLFGFAYPMQDTEFYEEEDFESLNSERGALNKEFKKTPGLENVKLETVGNFEWPEGTQHVLAVKWFGNDSCASKPFNVADLSVTPEMLDSLLRAKEMVGVSPLNAEPSWFFGYTRI